MDPRVRAVVAFVADLALVALFVAVGRASHREDGSAFLRTLWPFAAGLVAGWVVSRGWRRPVAVVPAGAAAWAGTLVMGMLLRALSGQGVQVAFVVVAAAVLATFLLGWRAVLAVVVRRRSVSAG